MKKILFLVRSTSPYKTQRRDIDYIIANLIAKGYQVDIYDPKQKILMQVNTQVTVNYTIFPKWMFFSKMYILLNFLVLLKFLVKNINKYDIVQINYVREEYLLFPFLLKRVGKKLILTLFGTDINKRTFIKNNFTRIYKLADAITVTNSTFGEIANKLIGNDVVASKLKVLMFPQDHFSLYREFNFPLKSEAKAKLKYPTDKTLVILGTNSTENEQHENIIAEIKKLKNPNNYFFVFPLSNRFNVINEREKKIQNLIQQELKDFHFDILIKFISFEDMATLRLASDIFVNLRKTDQLAASMLESNLSYTQIITGNWLPYTDYLSKVKVNLISDFGQLNDTLESLRNCDKKTLDEKLELNKLSVFKHYDINVLNSWIEFYNEQ